MTVESVTNIDDLDKTLPAQGDAGSEAAAHLRNIKSALQSSFDAMERIYSGLVRSNGNHDVPSGWSVSIDSTGEYTVTHSLGLGAAIDDQFIMCERGENAGNVIVVVKSVTANSFTINTYNASGPALSSEDFIFSFVVPS